MTNQRGERLIHEIRYIVLYIFVFLIAISYHPVIISMSRAADYESGTFLSRYIMYIFILLFFLCITFSFWKSRFARHYFLLLILVFVMSILVDAFFNNRMYLGAARDVALCFIALVIGWRLNMGRKDIERLLLFFSLVVLFSGLMQVLTNIGGFVIRSQYLADAKNSLGALLGTVIISMMIVWRSSKVPFVRLVAFFFLILGLVLVITIRARGALLSTVIVGLMVFFGLIRKTNVAILLVALFFIALISLPLMSDAVYNYVYDSLFSGTQSVDFTSGRLSTYQSAIEYLSEGENLFLGDVDQSFNLGSWIHNYFLLQVFRYGIVFSLPLLVLYLYVFYLSAKESMRIRSLINESGFPLVLVLFFISLLEPTFPYSPGTATLFNFVLMGVALRNQSEMAVLPE